MKKIEISCPNCNSEDITFVWYGMYAPEQQAEMEKGGFRIGGCVPCDDKWYCNNCNQYFKSDAPIPCAYCIKCKVLLAPEHVKIENDEKICLNCGSVL